MNGLNYLLQTNLYLLLFMGFYVLVLRNETFFRQNRLFLNTSIFLSFLIPFINSDWFRDMFITQKVREAAIMPSQMIYDTIIVGVNDKSSSLTVADAMFWVYSAGAAILLARFFLRLALLRSNLKTEKGAAFSFFNTLVVDRGMPKADTIIGHEKVHMRQWHSADIIFVELAAIINWFNPVMYLYKKEIRHIHEFIADEEAARLMESKSDYALLLFSNTLGVDPLHLSNNFFNKSLLKRRITMLHKTKSNKMGLWKYGFSAPLFILMLIVSAATASSESNALSIDSKNLPQFTEKLTEIIKESTPGSLSPGIPVVDGSSVGVRLNKSLAEDPGHFASPKSSITIAAHTADTIKKFSSVDVLPEFPGGMEGWTTYLKSTLKYPEEARKNKVTGRVILSYVVEKDGSLSDIKVVKGVGSGLDEEAVRVLTGSPKWKPGIDDGRPVRVAYTMPVFFQLGPAPDQTVTRSPAVKPNSQPGVEDFNSVDVLPEFQGGMEGWSTYLRSTLKYPDEARKNKVTGRVILSYVVEKDGSLADIKVVKGVGSGLDEEAVRVLAASPKWKPGILNGRPVRVAYTMPIFFGLGSQAENKP